MKSLTFEVTLTFCEKIESDDEILEVGNNILNALVGEISHGNGIAPQSSDNYTEEIQIRDPLTGIVLKSNSDSW